MLPTGDFPLSTSVDQLSIKHCVMVKLTDTSAKIIQEFLKNDDHCRKPSIVFKDGKGEISIPTNNDSCRKFQFGISSIKGSNRDATSSFECISYSENKLKEIGTIEQKITIQAISDEVFQATKERVTSVAEEEKKNSAIEIKSAGNRIIRPKQIKHTPHTDNANVSSSLNFHKKQRSVTERPIRERIIHLIAIKPYSKAELILRLTKDGITDKEKESIDHILSNAGTINTKTNQYELQNSIILGDVRDDWYFYSDAEKQLVKRVIKNAQSVRTAATLAAVQSRKSTNMNNAPNSDLSESSSINDIKKRTPPNFTDLPKQTDRQREIKLDEFFNSTTDRTLAENNITSNKTVNETKLEFKNDDKQDKKIENEKEYVTITSVEQYDKYIIDYNIIQKQYAELHDYMEPISRAFNDYNLKIKQYPTNSPEYDALFKIIIKSYEEKRRDEAYRTNSFKYNKLHEKLTHIKSLIDSYDKKHLK